MTAQEIETAVQAFAAAGASRGVIYMSTPVTTGRRELELMEKLGVGSQAELRRDHPEDWQRHVVQANEAAAARDADRLAEVAARGRLVVNPALINRDHWTQGDYDALWERVILAFPVTLAPMDGWAFSRGARLEVNLALREGLTVIGPEGETKDPADLLSDVRAADKEIETRGWQRFGYVLPPVTLSAEGPLPTPRREPQESYQRRVLTWLSTEHAYQVAKFGYEKDDDHTHTDGLAPGGWWDNQLATYLHRARVLGLESATGRQALAKFTATACGLLESVIRVYGELPPPGVPSGELKGRPTG